MGSQLALSAVCLAMPFPWVPLLGSATRITQAFLAALFVRRLVFGPPVRPILWDGLCFIIVKPTMAGVAVFILMACPP